MLKNSFPLIILVLMISCNTRDNHVNHNTKAPIMGWASWNNQSLTLPTLDSDNFANDNAVIAITKSLTATST